MAKVCSLAISLGLMIFNFVIMNMLWAGEFTGTVAKAFTMTVIFTTAFGFGIIMVPRPCVETFYGIFQLSVWTIFLVYWGGCSEKIAFGFYIMMDVSGALTLAFLAWALNIALSPVELPT